MAETTLKKNAKGYSYKYTDIAEIHEWLDSKGYTYYQFIEPIDGSDYIYTVPIIDGKELPPRRGCKVIIGALQGKSNPAQEQGSGLTYARRYSLLMAFGLATTDDDAQCMTKENNDKAKVEKQLIGTAKINFLIKKCQEDGVDPKKICEWGKVENFNGLTEKQYCYLAQNWSKEFKGGE